MKFKILSLLPFLVTFAASISFADLREDVEKSLDRAIDFYHSKVSTQGGYVYFYSTDLKQRWGEGVAKKSQIWVQPPGTPTVGLAFLKAYEVTGNQRHLKAATDAALALVAGQLPSGGWSNQIDFAILKSGKRRKNNSSLDDGQTQSATRLLIHVDQAHKFKLAKIHRAAERALDSLLKAQFPNGGFPQVWTTAVNDHPVLKANYPKYDWRTEGRIKNYWDMYTLNDNVCGYVAETLIDAHEIYKAPIYLNALKRLGNFLILAQMPKPQPAWAQQYNYKMQPIWARKFEPAGIASDESQEAIATLMKIYSVTGDKKYLRPIPAALKYLKASKLPDGQLARFYELKSNKPLYMKRRGKVYSLTYDDSNLPSHYGWKIKSRVEKLEKEYTSFIRNEKSVTKSQSSESLEKVTKKIVEQQDSQGRWVSIYNGERLVGQPRFQLNSRFISSQVFSENIHKLCEYLQRTAK